MDSTNFLIFDESHIIDRIYTIRGVQVMLSVDLANLYGVTTGALNQAVKRNMERFPLSFCFQLTDSDLPFQNLNRNLDIENGENLKSQNVISSWGGNRFLPYAFTQEGVAMLSAVLRSPTAVSMSIQIMSAFVLMRKQLLGNSGMIQRLERVEHKQLQVDEKLELLFKALDHKDPRDDKGIFYNGEIFDAWTFVSDIIRLAERRIILIDNYLDDSVFSLFTKRKNGVRAIIYTKKISNSLAVDLTKFNSQYEPITLKEYSHAHDRFLIIDDKEIYHFGASLKDLGKKWFAFSRFDKGALEMITKLSI